MAISYCSNVTRIMILSQRRCELQLVWKQILIYYVALINSDVSLLIDRRCR